MRWTVLLMVMGACGRQDFNENDAGGNAGSDAASGGPNIAFVTSSVHTGGFGGLTGADAICAARAADAHLAGIYVAYLSDGSATAASRLAGKRGWVRTDGKPVADLPTQLTNHTTWYPVDLDESGADLRGTTLSVWTGTSGNGTPSPDNCTAWSSNAGGGATGETGLLTAGGIRMTSVISNACANSARLFCFGIDSDAQLAKPAPTVGRLAFISGALWHPGGGVSAADAVCNNDGHAAGHPGAFAAALPTSTTTTASRYDSAGAPWVRADGLPVAQVAGAMFTAGNLDVPIILDATGAAVPDTSTWGGSPSSMAAVSCVNWTSSSNGNNADIGESDSTRLTERFALDQNQCDAGNRLLCLEN